MVNERTCKNCNKPYDINVNYDGKPYTNRTPLMYRRTFCSLKCKHSYTRGKGNNIYLQITDQVWFDELAVELGYSSTSKFLKWIVLQYKAQCESDDFDKQLSQKMVTLAESGHNIKQ